ncbi:DnaJ domain protein [Bacteriovorax sp. BAL6_X]|uniref:molecular chaperone DnaJ n=1 Tax=Bacteriovorax sp. BAL6_X TaxID=1201290 RepID=UPI0003856A96|nr:molecular chaperone DnaJ [Bacteriovorax sp. BAL6_X]EPZ49896.1 DnaJ domain protein [Bacteriovorax sp. BAL6_X]
MLPKIISNITLAFIAIILAYMLAPLFKEFFDGIFNPHKKTNKSHSKEEFDEMVRRKIERMSISGSSAPAESQSSKSTKSGHRTLLSYFEEKQMFASEEDLKFFQGLLSSLQWGDFKEGEEILNRLRKDYKFDKEELNALINPFIKQFFTKDELLKLGKINQSKLTKEAFISYATTMFLFQNLDRIEHKRYENNVHIFLINYSTKSTNHVGVLESFIKDELITLPKRYEALFESFTKKINASYDELFAILPIDESKLTVEFSSLKDESDRKKKYKKLVQTYHPDKWSTKFKSKIIDDRLNENFNKIQNIYNKTK